VFSPSDLSYSFELELGHSPAAYVIVSRSQYFAVLGQTVRKMLPVPVKSFYTGRKLGKYEKKRAM